MPEPGITRRHHPAFLGAHNARRVAKAVAKEEEQEEPLGRLPRVARLMALAIRFEHLIAEGVVRDQAELAELGHVTRPRVTQIMNLLHLAPDIQEAILYLPRVQTGKDRLCERHLRPIAKLLRWEDQRAAWRRLRAASENGRRGPLQNAAG